MKKILLLLIFSTAILYSGWYKYYRNDESICNTTTSNIFVSPKLQYDKAKESLGYGLSSELNIIYFRYALIFIAFLVAIYYKSKFGIASVLFVALLYLSYNYTNSAIKAEFNLRKKVFIKGDLKIKFSQIKALQTLKRKDCRKNKNNSLNTCIDIYEIDLLLENGRRENLICHDNREVIVSDLKLLSKTLKKPIEKLSSKSR